MLCFTSVVLIVWSRAFTARHSLPGCSEGTPLPGGAGGGKNVGRRPPGAILMSFSGHELFLGLMMLRTSYLVLQKMLSCGNCEHSN